jgi:hypothetical protein
MVKAQPARLLEASRRTDATQQRTPYEDKNEFKIRISPAARCNGAGRFARSPTNWRGGARHQLLPAAAYKKGHYPFEVETIHKPTHHRTARPTHQLADALLLPATLSRSVRRSPARRFAAVDRAPGASGRPAELYVTDAEQHFDVVVEMATSLLIGNPG